MGAGSGSGVGVGVGSAVGEGGAVAVVVAGGGVGLSSGSSLFVQPLRRSARLSVAAMNARGLIRVVAEGSTVRRGGSAVSAVKEFRAMHTIAPNTCDPGKGSSPPVDKEPRTSQGSAWFLALSPWQEA